MYRQIRTIAALTAEYGLIVVDPLNRELKRLSAPIYREAILRARETVDALLRRNDELAAAAGLISIASRSSLPSTSLGRTPITVDRELARIVHETGAAPMVGAA